MQELLRGVRGKCGLILRLKLISALPSPGEGLPSSALSPTGEGNCNSGDAPLTRSRAYHFLTLPIKSASMIATL